MDNATTIHLVIKPWTSSHPIYGCAHMTNNKFVHQTNLPFSAHEINIFHSRIALYSIITELCVWTRNKNKIHLQIYKKWWTLCFLNQAKSMLTYKEALMGGSCLCGQFGQVPFPVPLLGLSGYMYTNIHNSHLYLNWVMSLGFIWIFPFNSPLCSQQSKLWSLPQIHQL